MNEKLGMAIPYLLIRFLIPYLPAGRQVSNFLFLILLNEDYDSSVLVVTVLEVVPGASLLVTVVRLEALLLPPLKIATNRRINTAPPTTHTQGAVYHSVVCVVVVFVDVLELLF